MKNKTLNIWQIKKAAAKQVNSAFEKFFQAAAKPRARITCLACQLDKSSTRPPERVCENILNLNLKSVVV